MPALKAPASGKQESSRVLSAEIVRFTHRSARRYERRQISWSDRFIDVYNNVLGLGVALAMAGSFVFAMRNEIALRTAVSSIVRKQWFVLPQPVLWTLLGLAVLAAMSNLSRKLGPITVTGPESTWWLPLPLDRRPMVGPRFLRKVALTAVGSALAYLLFSVMTSLGRSPGEHLIASVAFGAAGMIAVLLAATQQLGIIRGRLGRFVAALVLLVSAVVPALAPGPLPAAALCVAAVGLLILVAPRAGLVSGEELTRGGALASQASASLFAMDSNEALRALGSEKLPSKNDGGRAAAFYGKPVRGPAAALIRADIVAFLRLHPPLLPPFVWLGACVASLLVEGGLPEFVQLAIIVVAGCATAAGMGSIARRAALVPELDALLPLNGAVVRTSRILMPAAGMALWMAVLSGILVLLGAADPALVLVGALAGVGMGAGTLRAATRPGADWSIPPIETPFGPVPRAQLTSVMRGLDVTILAMIPVVFSLYLGRVPLPVMAVQAVFSAGIFLVVVLSRPRRSQGGV
ncbi:DUF6297 family protein [Arthrobacter sp. efr-133-TYG-104]|uniref:DUF6297 family protein n=1 Tax=Arthrobacter sp. efr-133-TYG-104 TaxID=3040324 RepID=UPI002550E83B|nr:DUF6297 family protein [Arthrobacter sp. efr-133-TYG-104]